MTLDISTIPISNNNFINSLEKGLVQRLYTVFTDTDNLQEQTKAITQQDYTLDSKGFFVKEAITESSQTYLGVSKTFVSYLVPTPLFRATNDMVLTVKTKPPKKKNKSDQTIPIGSMLIQRENETGSMINLAHKDVVKIPSGTLYSICPTYPNILSIEIVARGLFNPGEQIDTEFDEVNARWGKHRQINRFEQFISQNSIHHTYELSYRFKSEVYQLFNGLSDWKKVLNGIEKMPFDFASLNGISNIDTIENVLNLVETYTPINNAQHQKNITNGGEHRPFEDLERVFVPLPKVKYVKDVCEKMYTLSPEEILKNKKQILRAVSYANGIVHGWHLALDNPVKEIFPKPLKKLLGYRIERIPNSKDEKKSWKIISERNDHNNKLPQIGLFFEFIERDLFGKFDEDNTSEFDNW